MRKKCESAFQVQSCSVQRKPLQEHLYSRINTHSWLKDFLGMRFYPSPYSTGRIPRTLSNTVSRSKIFFFKEDEAFLLSLDSAPRPPPFYHLMWAIINKMLKKCCSYKEVFRVMISYTKSYLFFRRDKKNCHRCRFCCSLPLCTFNTTKGIC